MSEKYPSEWEKMTYDEYIVALEKGFARRFGAWPAEDKRQLEPHGHSQDLFLYIGGGSTMYTTGVVARAIQRALSYPLSTIVRPSDNESRNSD
jgi:hypothetical protein